MTLRFRNRHVSKTIAEFIKQGMTELGWVNAPTNFGATPFIIREYQPERAGEDISENTLMVTEGDPGIAEPAEMGPGLWTYQVPVYVDIYGESRELARSVAGDMFDWIFRHPVIRVQDWTDPANPVDTTDVTVEWENLEGPLTPQLAASAMDFKRHWKVVKVEAHVFYLPDFY